MANSSALLEVNQPGQTDRNDGWWWEPLLVFLGFTLFIIYATWAAFQGKFYHLEDAAAIVIPQGMDAASAVRPYLSPLYSPDLPRWFPNLFGWFTLSPALLILPFPGLFRATCYYYRKAYYRAFFMSPSACAVGGQSSPLAWLLGSQQGYTGETRFPMIFQNFHRFTFYIAALFIVIMGWDEVWSLIGWQHVGYADGKPFHVGVGSLVLILNVVLLALYTFSCHSWRHLLAGKLDCFSCSNFTEKRYEAWKRQSSLNEHHMLFAWLSLVWVGFTDVYVRMCAMGI